MITIEQVENFLWESFGQTHYARTETNKAINIQDLAPELADFLHEHGVAIDWSDGSRFGTVVSADSTH